MSTSLLYHAFGIRGYQYVNSSYECGEVTFRIIKRKQDLACPACGSRKVVRKGTVDRWFNSVPIGSKPVKIVLAVQRVLCRVCDCPASSRTGLR